jgi:hypothetical protein|tara:strand:- start:3629 stop:3928 length:300 start_codon:yes stop_codon:yes gene_type:complete
MSVEPAIHTEVSDRITEALTGDEVAIVLRKTDNSRINFFVVGREDDLSKMSVDTRALYILATGMIADNTTDKFSSSFQKGVEVLKAVGDIGGNNGSDKS